MGRYIREERCHVADKMKLTDSQGQYSIVEYGTTKEQNRGHCSCTKHTTVLLLLLLYLKQACGVSLPSTGCVPS